MHTLALSHLIISVSYPYRCQRILEFYPLVDHDKAGPISKNLGLIKFDRTQQINDDFLKKCDALSERLTSSAGFRV